MKGPSTIRRRKSHTPSPQNLAELGSERLGQLLFAAAKADTALMRALHREMAAVHGGLDEEIDKQIARVRKASSWLDAKKSAALTRELTGLRHTIVSRLGDDQPAAALVRLFDFIALAPGVLGRRRDGEQALGELFQSAVDQVGDLLARVLPISARAPLADSACKIFLSDGDNITEGLIGAIAGALDTDGRKTLRQTLQAELQSLKPGRSGTDSATVYRLLKLTEALGEIADAEGDVDAFIAAQQHRPARLRDTAAVAERLLQAGRADEALTVIDKAEPDPAKPPHALANLRIQALDLLGQGDEAQASRWSQFQKARSIDALRAYLKRLPDFEDMEREQEALDQVSKDKNALAALGFLIAWPDLKRAAALVRTKLTAMDGDAYWVLTPAADALAHRDPLAATLLYRQMIDLTLARAKSARYGHAAKHLTECSGLAKTIEADSAKAAPAQVWEGWPSHDVYLAGLLDDHRRKASFWKRVKL